uniref:Uncharacterized protein n=1 Tax=viral metagenome TaxID=1070528 RepID=A0A6C0DR28_9ZZZZ
MSAFSNSDIVGVDINDNSTVLPKDTFADTGGITMIYESKGGRKSKDKKSARKKKSKAIEIMENQREDVRVCNNTSSGGKKSKKTKSKRSKSCKQKIINIYM